MSGFVYFIAPEAVFFRKEEDLQVVKIGYTRFNPRSRMMDLQCGSPVALELVAYIEGSLQIERAFHGCFGPLRWQGEWFLLDRKLHDFLSYFIDLPHDNRFVSRERLCSALHDNVWTKHSPLPRRTDEEYVASAEHRFLIEWFPEVCEL